MQVDIYDDMKTTSFYDEASNQFITKIEYDPSEVFRMNEYLRNTAPETGRYKGNFVKIGEVPIGVLQDLKKRGYDILSSDPDESHRALLMVQSECQKLMTVPGTPIAKKRTQWV